MSLGAGAAAGRRSCVRLGPLLCAGAVAAAAGKVFLLSGVYAGVIQESCQSSIVLEMHISRQGMLAFCILELHTRTYTLNWASFVDLIGREQNLAGIV